MDIRARTWAAHREAMTAVGFEGPAADEFWRLTRTGAPLAQIVRFGKDRHVQEYTRIRNERMEAADLMALDELQPGAALNLPVLKKLGNAHLVTLSRNRDAINATLDRLNVWMHFDRKQVLPVDQDRRVQTLRELAGEYAVTLAIVGTVPMAYAAGEAGCRLIGLSNGPVVPKLLRQVGVDLVYPDLDALTDALSKRDPDLERIGVY